MLDITFCKGGECRLKDICLRFKTGPEELLESYFIEPPFKVCERMDGDSHECAYFIDVDRLAAKRE